MFGKCRTYRRMGGRREDTSEKGCTFTVIRKEGRKQRRKEGREKRRN